MSKKEQEDMLTPRREHIVAVAAKQAVEGIAIVWSFSDMKDEDKLSHALQLINFYRSIHRAATDPRGLEGWN